MSSRRPLQPIPALSANVASTRAARTTTTARTADGSLDMEDDAQDHVQHSDSVVSGLSSLSGDDDFERLMIENARAERRRLQGGHQPAFGRARTQARVGLTLAQLERNDAQSRAQSSGGHARAAPKSPPTSSSSGSTRSDPAIHAPAGWGRKGRTRRDWMRSITRDAPPPPPPPPPPAPAVDDSPLSHKSFQPASPRPDSTGELDLTFDMNEASMLASTPYMPRSTRLDDIREREAESQRELEGQRLTTARLERTREQQTREQQPREQPREPVRGLRRRTNSWQSLTKSQPELGKENAPIAVYRKSIETVGVIERDVIANAERPPPRPFTTRRHDSQDLLRRLARASNTPSPSAPPPRPQPDPAPQPHTSPQAVLAGSPCPAKDDAANDMAAQTAATASTASTASTATPHDHPQRERRHDTPHDRATPDLPSPAQPAADVDATPMPTEQPVQHPKTPYVMGGWVDTPGPRTAHKPLELPRPPSQSPQQGNASKSDSKPVTAPDDEQPAVEQSAAPIQHSLPHPQLPSSALHALVQEARASHDYGEDTIHSLEDLMAHRSDNETEEDTLQDMPLPTSAPRNEAERARQAETVHMHRLRQHLRATETNLRDVSRGMRRVETMVEHSKAGTPGERAPVIVRDLRTDFSPWTWFRSFFWDERLKTQRQVANGPLKLWGGVTLLGILLTLSFIWWASETVACEVFCHPEYASYSPYPFAVNMDAPKRGVVIPTLVYRTLFRSWSTPIVSPIASLSSWIWSALWSFSSSISMTGLSRASYQAAANAGSAAAAHTQAWIQREDLDEEESWDWSMAEDEVLRR